MSRPQRLASAVGFRLEVIDRLGPPVAALLVSLEVALHVQTFRNPT